jgi:hypothetical protein
MKKVLFFLLFAFAIVQASAQSPAVLDFREFIKAIPTNFKTLEKEYLKESDGYKVYSSTKEDLFFSTNLITRHPTDGTAYLLRYNIKDLDAGILKMFMMIAQQYMDEINAMVKTGNYTGRDFKDGESDVTELKDLEGNLIMQYISDKETHMLAFFGKKN